MRRAPALIRVAATPVPVLQGKCQYSKESYPEEKRQQGQQGQQPGQLDVECSAADAPDRKGNDGREEGM